MIASAKIKAITQPITDDASTAEEFITYCARVSNPTNQSNYKTANKLIEYLIANKHWSPFEMVNVVMEIETTRDISHQILRHRSFSFQEFSQRYADPTKHLSFTSREFRLQDKNNRQNSIKTDDNDISKMWDKYVEEIITKIDGIYEWAIGRGLAKEQARAILPEGLTVTRLYMSGTLRSWIHYCDLRMENGTQKEHREVANECWKEICKEFPAVMKAIDNIKQLEKISGGT